MLYTVILLEMYKQLGKTVKRQRVLYSGNNESCANMACFQNGFEFYSTRVQRKDNETIVTLVDKQF